MIRTLARALTVGVASAAFGLSATVAAAPAASASVGGAIPAASWVYHSSYVSYAHCQEVGQDLYFAGTVDDYWCRPNGVGFDLYVDY